MQRKAYLGHFSKQKNLLQTVSEGTYYEELLKESDTKL